MNLITKKQFKTKEKEQKDKLVSEILVFQEKKANIIKEYNDIKMKKELYIANLDNQINTKKSEHKTIISLLNKEISDLNNAKIEALRPLNKEKEQLNIRKIKIDKKETKLIAKENHLVTWQNELEKQNHIIEEDFNKLLKMKDYITEQMEALSIMEVRAKKQMKECLAESEKFYKDRDIIQKKNDKELVVLKAKQRALDGYAISLSDKENQLIIKENKLISDKAALETAKREIYGRSKN